MEKAGGHRSNGDVARRSRSSSWVAALRVFRTELGAFGFAACCAVGYRDYAALQVK